MRRFLLALMAAGVIAISGQSIHADADTTSQPFQSSFFGQNSTDDNDFQFSNSAQRPNANRLAIPDNTPTPLEGCGGKRKR